jgi:hypothetical protein
MVECLECWYDQADHLDQEVHRMWHEVREMKLALRAHNYALQRSTDATFTERVADAERRGDLGAVSAEEFVARLKTRAGSR